MEEADAMNDVHVAKTRRDLDEAIQQHMTALNGPGVVTDWAIYAERVGFDDDVFDIVMAVSEKMSVWKLRGLMYYASKFVGSLTA